MLRGLRGASHAIRSGALPFFIPKQYNANEIESVTDAVAKAAIEKRKNRVLVPIVFKERIVDGFGVYKFSYVDKFEDLHAYQKQMDLQKQDVSMLEFLEEGEDEKNASAKVLLERYGEKIRTEPVNRKILHRKMSSGKDLTPEHPADVFINVSDPAARSFHENWETTKQFEHEKFFPPGRNPLMDMLKQSRTRRHFERARILLHKYDRKCLFWPTEDKLTVIEFSKKHNYSCFLNPKFRTNTLTNFFDSQIVFEQYLSFLVGMKRSKLKFEVEQIIRDKFGYFSKDGYHLMIQGYYKAKDNEKVLSLFREMLLEAKIHSFSLALWDCATKAMLLTKNFDAFDEMTAIVGARFLNQQKARARTVLCLLASGKQEEAERIIKQAQSAKPACLDLLATWKKEPQMQGPVDSLTHMLSAKDSK